MANLYELNAEFNQLWMLLEDEEVDEEMILGAFETATEDLTVKLENCCKYIKNIDAEIAGLKAEEERLYARRKAKENAVKRLKELMKLAMNTAGEKKLPCGTFTVSVQNNAPSVIMDEQCIENIPEDYLKYRDPEIDKKKLKDHLEKGIAPEGIAHLEVSSSVRIR